MIFALCKCIGAVDCCEQEWYCYLTLHQCIKSDLQMQRHQIDTNRWEMGHCSNQSPVYSSGPHCALAVARSLPHLSKHFNPWHHLFLSYSQGEAIHLLTATASKWPSVCVRLSVCLWPYTDIHNCSRALSEKKCQSQPHKAGAQIHPSLRQWWRVNAPL